MVQLTLRIDEALARRLKAVAAAQQRSVNAYASAVLRAAVDPDLVTDEAMRVRERLAQAGLLAPPSPSGRSRPEEQAVRGARHRAGQGRPLSELIGEGRN